MRHSSCAAFILVSAVLAASEVRASDQPNILWITSEDNGPYLGCYGDSLAQTPRLDQLAAEGVRYQNAFANAPVCSPARSTLIMGMYASTLGMAHHDSSVRIPDRFPAFPNYLREAGYFCTNAHKTHYNFTRDHKACWDQCAPEAHYRNRQKGQPFFAVFNIFTTHESQLQESVSGPRRRNGLLPPQPRLSLREVPLPPYHPDTPIIRKDWATFYDNMTLMDQQVGQLLDELTQQGEDENTIVFYFSDHGGAMPGGKRSIHDSGTRIPLIIRFPEKWKHLASAQDGEWVDEPVSLVDFAPTILHLCGVAAPNHFQGSRFLGETKEQRPAYVYLFRERVNNRYDTVRSIRDRRFQYIRNYSSHRTYGQENEYTFRVLPSMVSWYEEWLAGRCDEVQSRYWEPKPVEELYEVNVDPYQIRNLAGDPDYDRVLIRMRKQLDQTVRQSRDTGFVPEGMFARLCGDETIYDYVQSDRYPFAEVHRVAKLASQRTAAHLHQLQAAMTHAHPAVRYWAAQGCLILGEAAEPALLDLQKLLSDPNLDVRVPAAEAIAQMGHVEAAFPVLIGVVHQGNRFEANAALNALDFLIADGRLDQKSVVESLQGYESDFEYVRRYLRILRSHDISPP
jgi:arylsulfatase A-like enzyme